jgi:GTP-binding protein HflX
LFTDTVGFIQKLPTQLVAAFRATLEEITEADALLHVVDITHPNAVEQAESVMDTLRELGAGNKQMLIALNKCDKLSPEEVRARAVGILGNGIPISGLKRIGFDGLLREVEAMLFERLVPVKVRLPYKAGDLMALFRREGAVELELAEERGIVLSGRIPGRLLDTFTPYAA